MTYNTGLCTRIQWVPFLDNYLLIPFNFLQVTKEESEDAPKLPAAMIQSISDEIYEQYVTMVTGLFPEIREDFVLSIIITAIIFYDPDRPDLRDRELVRKEQDLFYNILIKYLVLKFGFQGIKTRLQGVTLRERVNSRILVYLRRMKKLFEQTVIYPNFRIIEDQTQLSIKSNWTFTQKTHQRMITAHAQDTK